MATDIAIESPSILVTEYGIEFPGNPTLPEWKQAMLGLQKAQTRLQFYLGDMFIYAEYTWGGSIYADLVEHSGYDIQTIRNYVWVARRFPSEFRKAVIAQSSAHADICAFSHYVKVAALDDDQEAMRLLKMTSKAGWSCERLHDEVKKIKYGGKEPTEPMLNLRISRNEARFIFDALQEYPEDPTAASLSGRIGELLEAG